MWFFSFLMFGIFLVMGSSTALTPIFSRKSTPFGVAVSGKHDFVEEKKKNFAFWSMLSCIILGLPIFVYPLFENNETTEILVSMYMVGSIVVYLFISTYLYLRYRKQIVEWKGTHPIISRQVSKRVVIDVNYRNKLQTKSSWTFFIWQAVIIIISILIAIIFYEKIPHEIPVNWNSQFEVSRTVTKNFRSVFALPLLQMALVPVLIYSNYAIVKSKQRLSPLGPEDASEKSLHFRKAWSNFNFAMTISTQLFFSYIFLFSLFSGGKLGWTFGVVTLFYLIFTVGGTIYLTVKYGQAGEKLLTEDEQYYLDPDEEDLWKFGTIYYNKIDPSIFVEKRFGIGPTLNMARWQSWAFVIGILAFVVLSIILANALT